MAPWFSVILPIYNVEQYLQRCVRSVESQSFSDYELILVDDGSTDSSGELCDTLARQYDNITVIHKENGGLSSARNAGLEAARGQYIWWVDSDDWIEPQALELLYEQTKNAPDMVKFNYYRVEQEAAAVCSAAASGSYQGQLLEQLGKLAFFSPGKFPLSAWSYIYRRSFLQEKKLWFVSERIVGSEDYLFNLEALQLAQHIVVTDSILYDYEQRAGSLTQKYRENLPEKYTKLYLMLRERFANAGKLEDCEGKLYRFYVWHLLHGTCITNEYLQTADHSIQEGRKNVRRFLCTPECKKAVDGCDRTGMTPNQKLQLLAMRWGIEPVFYRLWKGKKP